MASDELAEMRETIALGRYADYGGRGDFRYNPQERVMAANALALLRIAGAIDALNATLEQPDPDPTGEDGRWTRD